MAKPKLPKRVWVVVDDDCFGIQVFRSHRFAKCNAFGDDRVAAYELRQPKRRRKARRK